MSSPAFAARPALRRSHAFGTWSGEAGTFDPKSLASRLEAFGDWTIHAWTPQGLSAASFRADRTVVLHTWPERGIATLDVWSAADADAYIDAIARALGWTHRQRTHLDRGP